MPKAGSIHKNYREIEVVFTDGERATMRSCFSNKDKSNVLKCDIDPKTHPAWTQDISFVNQREDSVVKFNNKFAGLSFMAKKPS